MSGLEQTLFGLFLIFTGSSVGIAGITGWMRWRLYRLTMKKSNLPFLGLKLGVVLTNGVLIEVLSTNPRVQDSWQAWAYLAGLICITSSLFINARDLILELASAEEAIRLYPLAYPPTIEAPVNVVPPRQHESADAKKEAGD